MDDLIQMVRSLADGALKNDEAILELVNAVIERILSLQQRITNLEEAIQGTQQGALQGINMLADRIYTLEQFMQYDGKKH